MPILRLCRFTPGGSRSATASPWQCLWMEIAAWWPCSTAQMMFFGPNAASPPKNTPARVDWKVFAIDHRHVPLVELDAEIALDPGERVFLADGEDHVVRRQEFLADDALGGDAAAARRCRIPSCRTVMPVSLPFSTTNAFGERLMTISTLSSSASSSSQAEALKNARGLRAITFTLFAPRRSEVRQQSIAVLPTPMISTRSPIFSMCPKATDSSQAMPMWMLAAPSCAAGQVQLLALRRAGADEHRIEAALRRAARAGSRWGG